MAFIDGMGVDPRQLISFVVVAILVVGIAVIARRSQGSITSRQGGSAAPADRTDDTSASDTSRDRRNRLEGDA